MSEDVTPKPAPIEPDYIGDGVYVCFDGYHVWLGLDAHQKLIGLEPSVMGALMNYGRRAWGLE